MRKIYFVFIFTFLSLGSNAQSFVGAWEAFTTSQDGEPIRNVVIFSEKYQVSTWFHSKTGAFIKTNGGSWKLEGNTMTEKIEFDTDNPERVGSEIRFKIYNHDTIMGIAGDTMRWRRIDSGAPGELRGAWLMSGRVRDGKTQTRDTNRPRKTMKILSGTRFQWIAYNTETKQFMGTGGGTYTTRNGKYTENIEFFSRDIARVGLSLHFDYSLVKGNWHHSGKSSKGNPIYEIWSRREY
ncbi:membrane or secreted protein [Ascidiimonas aurantiaca]|uniref:membrane or secreted protein n=1 Tax=Ascidiimonas aurantiaca TaxID=1685432 RepID=UPI0030EC5C04